MTPLYFKFYFKNVVGYSFGQIHRVFNRAGLRGGMYRRISSQNNLLTDGSRKIKKIPKCRELSYLGKYFFLFLKTNFIF